MIDKFVKWLESNKISYSLKKENKTTRIMTECLIRVEISGNQLLIKDNTRTWYLVANDRGYLFLKNLIEWRLKNERRANK